MMKFTIQQAVLLDCLKIVSRAVSTQNTLPVLGNILIRAEGKKVFFMTTNLELVISTSCEATVKNEGAITVPAKIITSYISLIEKGEIELTVTGGTALEVKAPNSKTKIKGISAEEFPEVPVVEKAVCINLPAEEFRTAVAEVAFAAQENASRPIITGVLFRATKNVLKMVATNSFRLSEKTISLKDVTEDQECVIPVRAIYEADRLLAITDEDSAKLTIDKNQAMFTFGDTKLISRLIDGKYPRYENILPASAATKVKVSQKDFEMAVRRVSIFAKENNNSMRLEFGDNKMVVSTDTTEIGEGQTDIPIELEGGSNVIILSSDYVLDVLNALSSEEAINIEMTESEAPAVFKKDGYLHLIMSFENKDK